ncbi:Unknown protein [Striga hermonthica]|uniref:Reverse transcriptase zinc-binding domain-containing protein n=1 Tax=Striga hermonthica TaxID=68872 RepID=A0A9N7N6A7_STRHE|nr:Unknown protein [Striga hermonthica]
MQSARLPNAICEGLEKRCRRFVWGGSGDTRKLSLVKWNEVCQARRCGGLGLKRQRLMNDALLMKLGWKYLTDHNALWVHVWKAKYGDGPLSAVPGHRSSAVLQAVKKVWSSVVKGARWAVCNSRTAMFWMDRWLPSGTVLLDVAVNEVPASLLGRTIAATPPPHINLGRDRLYWGPFPTGKFTTRSAYELLADDQNLELATSDKQQLWRVVWRWLGPQHIRTFLWLLTKNRLLTNEERRRRHLAADALCGVCSQADESALHVLRDCHLAAAIWMKLLPSDYRASFFALQLDDWVLSNLMPRPDHGYTQWDRTFGVVVWKIWKWRNEHIFQGKTKEVECGLREILAYIEGLDKVRECDKKLGGSRRFLSGGVVMSIFGFGCPAG